MRTLIGSLLILLFLSCDKTKTVQEKELKPFIISEFERKLKNSNSDIPLPPIPIFYGSDNFILDSKDNIYYFKRPEIGSYCATDTENDTIPYFENILPEEIQLISPKKMSKFIKQTIKKGQRNFITIASQKDTLNSKTYTELLKQISTHIDKQDRDNYFIRKTREEEDSVLYYKKSKKPYNVRKIKWDESRIILPDSIKK